MIGIWLTAVHSHFGFVSMGDDYKSKTPGFATYSKHTNPHIFGVCTADFALNLIIRGEYEAGIHGTLLARALVVSDLRDPRRRVVEY